MRRSEIEILTTPYSSGADERPNGLARALGVDIPGWSQLEAAVSGDLTTAEPFGIRWWDPHPDLRRRLLIGDYLVNCIRSTSDNLIESALHWLEYLDHSERDSDFIANCVALEGGFPVFRNRPKETPAVLPQPAQQWPKLPATPPEAGFTGYRPGAVPYNPSVLNLHPQVVLRLSAAAVLDDQRHVWVRQDEEEGQVPK